MRSENRKKGRVKVATKEEGRPFSSDWMPGGATRNVHLMSNPAARRRLTKSFQVNGLLLYQQDGDLDSGEPIPSPTLKTHKQGV